LYKHAKKEVLKTLTSEPSTSNFHHWCMTMDNFTSSTLGNIYTPLATSTTLDNYTFISNIEAKQYPFWGVQFHPEKNIYEWSYDSIPHDLKSVQIWQYFAEFFVRQARRSLHSFASGKEEADNLIYNYEQLFTGNVSHSFLQCYFFD